MACSIDGFLDIVGYAHNQSHHGLDLTIALQIAEEKVPTDKQGANYLLVPRSSSRSDRFCPLPANRYQAQEDNNDSGNGDRHGNNLDRLNFPGKVDEIHQVVKCRRCTLKDFNVSQYRCRYVTNTNAVEKPVDNLGVMSSKYKTIGGYMKEESNMTSPKNDNNAF